MGTGVGSGRKRSDSDTVVCTLDSTATRHFSRVPDKRYEASDFEVLRTVGTGSYSVVKLAIDKASGSPVVLKVMSKSLIIRKGQVEHIKNERAILALVKCQFIEQMKASFQTPISLFYVLEYIPGGELFKLLSDRSVLPEGEAVFYAAEIVCALRYLHSLKCVFRDLKPENVLIAADGHLKVADFGFAKVLRSEEKTFTLCGTPEYMAPEVIERGGHGLSTDWWQLGILIYEMLYATTPFTDPSPYQLYENIISKPVHYPTGSPVALSLLTGLLQKRPVDRFTEEEILKHPFFQTIDWTVAERKELRPPFVPQVTSPTDSSNFDTYNDSTQMGTAVYVDVFPEF